MRSLLERKKKEKRESEERVKYQFKEKKWEYGGMGDIIHNTEGVRQSGWEGRNEEEN